jgi:decaprenyl-phosphate phosphoribosyltransferase
MGRVSDYLTLARPAHWTKNAFVLMPVPFGVAAGARLDPPLFLAGVVGMGLASSAVYALNDAQDAARDRLHPDKRERPVAAGRISPAGARIFAAILVVLGVGLVGLSGRLPAVALLGVYLVLNLAYSLGAKHVPLVDVFLLSSGYVLRVLLGCSLIFVRPSNWLLLCSSALALFLALIKRRADVARRMSHESRPSLAGYTLSFLDLAIGVSTSMTLVGYALYCMEAKVLVPGREFASLPFVLFGVLDYLRESMLTDRGGAPLDLILSSPALLGCGVGWALSTLWSVGLF